MTNSEHFLKAFRIDINKTKWLFIFIFFIAGIENITSPPLDDHMWRQSLTIMMAKNFQTHPNIFYPRTDIGGETDGIIASEFPLYSYLLSILYKVFGYQSWYGRLVSWIFGFLLLWSFSKLTEELTNKRIALFATIIIVNSIIFQFARKSMPDVFALSLVTSGIYLYLLYFKENKLLYLFLGELLFTLGGLSKLTYTSSLVFLCFPLLSKVYSKHSKIIVILTLIISLAIISTWYFYWVPYLQKTFKNPLMFPSDFAFGWHHLINNLDLVLSRFRVNAFGYLIPYNIAIFGVVVAFVKINKDLIFFYLISFLVTLLFIIKSGDVFATHTYYVMFCIPFLSIFIGYFIDEFPIKSTLLKIVLLAIIIIPSYLINRQQSFNFSENKYLLTLGPIVDKYIPKDSKIMINNGIFNPSNMFYANRKGWAVNPDVVSKYEWMPDFKKDGLQYIIINKHISDDTLNYQLIFENKDFKIYKP